MHWFCPWLAASLALRDVACCTSPSAQLCAAQQANLMHSGLPCLAPDAECMLTGPACHLPTRRQTTRYASARRHLPGVPSVLPCEDPLCVREHHRHHCGCGTVSRVPEPSHGGPDALSSFPDHPCAARCSGRRCGEPSAAALLACDESAPTALHPHRS